MATVGLLGAFATFVVFAWRNRAEDVITAEEAGLIDRANRRARQMALLQMQPAE